MYYLPGENRPTQEVRCPVHGFIKYSKNERKIIDHPAFQRLRHVRQLAMEYLVYPGAEPLQTTMDSANQRPSPG